MDFLHDLLLVLHFIGIASLLGGFLVQMKPKTKVINAAMFHGVLTQLVTGILLTGVAEMQARDADWEVDHAKIGTKLVVTAIIAVLVIVNRKKESVTVPVWAAIGGLTVVNIVIAVFWN